MIEMFSIVMAQIAADTASAVRELEAQIAVSDQAEREAGKMIDGECVEVQPVPLLSKDTNEADRLPQHDRAQ